MSPLRVEVPWQSVCPHSDEIPNTHTHTRAYTHTQTHTRRHTQTSTHVSTHTQAHTQTHAHTHRHTHTQRHTRTSTHISTHKHTHTHTPTQYHQRKLLYAAIACSLFKKLIPSVKGWSVACVKGSVVKWLHIDSRGSRFITHPVGVSACLQACVCVCVQVCSSSNTYFDPMPSTTP